MSTTTLELADQSMPSLLWRAAKLAVAKRISAEMPSREVLPRPRSGSQGEPRGWNDAAAYENFKGWVYSAVDAKAKRVAELHVELWRVGTDGEEMEIFAHPYLDGMRRPNPIMTGYVLRYLTSVWLDLNGNAYWLKIKSGLGVVTGYFPLRPDLVRIVLSKTDGFIGFNFFPNGLGNEKQFIPREEVIHFAEPNPSDLLQGFATIRGAVDDINADNAARAFVAKFFKNQARPDYVLESPVTTTEDIARLQARLYNFHAGYDNFGLPAVLPLGSKITPLTFNPADSQLHEGFERDRDSILAAVRTPKIVLGLTDGVNFATADKQLTVWNQASIAPRLTLIHEGINCQHLEVDYQTGPRVARLESRFENPVAEDREQKREDLKLMFSTSSITPNEIREEFGLDPMPNADDLLAPASLFPLGDISSSSRSNSNGQAALQVVPQAKAEAIDAVAVVVPQARRLRAAKVLDFSTAEARSAIWKRSDRLMASGERVMRRTFERTMRRQGERVVAKLEAQLALRIAAFAGWSKEKVRRKLVAQRKEAIAKQEVDPILGGAWDDSQENLFVGAQMSPAIANATALGGNAAAAQIGIDFSLDSPLAQEFLAQKRAKLAGQVNATTKAQLSASLAAGLEAGEALRDLINRAEEVFDMTGTPGGRERAVRVARTETTAAFSRGKILAATSPQAEGVVKSKVWLTADDDRVRDGAPGKGNHVILDGVTLPLFDESGQESVFSNGLTSPGIVGPSPGAGIASEIVNCRCDIVFEVEGE